MEEVPNSPQSTFEFSEIQIAVDKLNNELFIQSYIDYVDDLDSIISVSVQLYSYYNGGYHSIGEYNLYDDGSNGDIISENGRYSILTSAEELDFTDVEPSIKLINMENSFQLSESIPDSLEIEVVVSGKLMKADFMAVDTWGNMATNSQYVNVSNNYIEIQVDSDNMYKDIYPDDDELCERDTEFTSNGLVHYFNIVDNERYGSSNNFSYFIKIPFRPLDECGGTGEVLFSFVLHDLDFGNCVSSDLEGCTINVMDNSEYTLWVHGCGDGICMSNYENSLTCSEDCQ